MVRAVSCLTTATFIDYRSIHRLSIRAAELSAQGGRTRRSFGAFSRCAVDKFVSSNRPFFRVS